MAKFSYSNLTLTLASTFNRSVNLSESFPMLLLRVPSCISQWVSHGDGQQSTGSLQVKAAYGGSKKWLVFILVVSHYLTKNSADPFLVSP